MPNTWGTQCQKSQLFSQTCVSCGSAACPAIPQIRVLWERRQQQHLRSDEWFPSSKATGGYKSNWNLVSRPRNYL